MNIAPVTDYQSAKTRPTPVHGALCSGHLAQLLAPNLFVLIRSELWKQSAGCYGQVTVGTPSGQVVRWSGATVWTKYHTIKLVLLS